MNIDTPMSRSESQRLSGNRTIRYAHKDGRSKVHWAHAVDRDHTLLLRWCERAVRCKWESRYAFDAFFLATHARTHLVLTDGNVCVWDRHSGALLNVLAGHGTQCVSAVACNPAKKNIFASCSDDKTVRVWQLK